MKRATTLFGAALLATASFSTLAATPLSEADAQNMQPAGTISVSGVRGTLDDATRQLSQKAEEMGATHFRVIGAQNPGDSSLWNGSAEIYR